MKGWNTHKLIEGTLLLKPLHECHVFQAQASYTHHTILNYVVRFSRQLPCQINVTTLFTVLSVISLVLSITLVCCPNICDNQFSNLLLKNLYENEVKNINMYMHTIPYHSFTMLWEETQLRTCVKHVTNGRRGCI